MWRSDNWPKLLRLFRMLSDKNRNYTWFHVNSNESKIGIHSERNMINTWISSLEKRIYVHINSMIGVRFSSAWFGLVWGRYESMCSPYVEDIDLFLSIQHNGHTYPLVACCKIDVNHFCWVFLVCVTWAHKMWCVTLNKLTIWCIAHRMLIASSIKPNVALCRILCTHEAAE